MKSRTIYEANRDVALTLEAAAGSWAGAATGWGDGGVLRSPQALPASQGTSQLLCRAGGPPGATHLASGRPQQGVLITINSEHPFSSPGEAVLQLSSVQSLSRVQLFATP